MAVAIALSAVDAVSSSASTIEVVLSSLWTWTSWLNDTAGGKDGLMSFSSIESSEGAGMLEPLLLRFFFRIRLPPLFDVPSTQSRPSF